MDIREALSQLDTMDDDLWTANGDPKVDAVEKLVGEDISRQDIINAAPGFKRENPVVPDQEEAQPEESTSEEEQGDEPDPKVMTQLQELVQEEPKEEQEFSQFLSGFPRQGLPELETLLIEQSQAAERAQKQAEEIRRRTKIALSMTRSRIRLEMPDMSNQEAIREYIESQNQQRADRVARSREILRGVNPKDLDPRATIDKSMARKTNRGAKRPTR